MSSISVKSLLTFFLLSIFSILVTKLLFSRFLAFNFYLAIFLLTLNMSFSTIQGRHFLIFSQFSLWLQSPPLIKSLLPRIFYPLSRESWCYIPKHLFWDLSFQNLSRFYISRPPEAKGWRNQSPLFHYTPRPSFLKSLYTSHQKPLYFSLYWLPHSSILLFCHTVY